MLNSVNRFVVKLNLLRDANLLVAEWHTNLHLFAIGVELIKLLFDPLGHVDHIINERISLDAVHARRLHKAVHITRYRLRHILVLRCQNVLIVFSGAVALGGCLCGSWSAIRAFWHVNRFIIDDILELACARLARRCIGDSWRWLMVHQCD
jgi:hypothetical protein